MSVKEELKEELKQDEELLVKVFKLEKFVKKYKKPLIALAVILVIAVLGYKVNNYLQTQKLIKQNNALDRLLANPNDKEALKIVKENKRLYDLYLLRKGDFKDITSPQLQAIKAYEIAMRKGDIKSLKNYLMNPNYDILKNAVRLALIRAYLEKGDRKKAKEVYDNIDDNSKYKMLGLYLLHYGIVK